MQAIEQEPIELPIHNWEALHQIEKERDWISSISGGLSVAGFATGALLNTAGFLLLALAYRPMIRWTKLARIAKIMHLLLEEFEGQRIQIFPCLRVPDHEPLDLFVILPEKAYFIISIRSKSKEEAKVVFKEDNETLYIKHKRKGLRKWLPCPLVELSEYHSWLNKNRKTFGISANAIRKYPVIKTLVLWHPMEIEQHREHLYSKDMEGVNALRLSRKGTALVIKEDEVIDFIKACLAESEAKLAK